MSLHPLMRSSILRFVIIGVICFYLGMMASLSFSTSSSPGRPMQPPLSIHQSTHAINSVRDSQLLSELDSCKALLASTSSSVVSLEKQLQQQLANQANNPASSAEKSFPILASASFGKTRWGGVSSVSISDLLTRSSSNGGVDLGVPSLDESLLDHALVFHHQKALPNDSARSLTSSISVDEALKNCGEVDVLITQGRVDDHCLVVMENYPGSHIHRFMRLPEKRGDKEWSRPSDPSAPRWPLVRVGRNDDRKGSPDRDGSPTVRESKEHFRRLSNFFAEYEGVLKRLKPVLAPLARQNTVVVMVANAGVMDMVGNFACSARSKGIDLSNVIVFATDKEALAIARDIGIAAFYDEDGTFGAGLPIESARGYGDGDYSNMMYAKVVAVYLPMLLGYNVLFQDVDIVWNTDPLPYFLNSKESGNFDTYFMDDGARTWRFPPFCANTGFYFLRNNDKTMYLMTSTMYAGDLIISTRSHQQVFDNILAEHNSQFGLTVKTLDEVYFPSGRVFHHKQDWMKSWMKNEMEPIIFHMSWTQNMEEKKPYMKQLGVWHLKEDGCLRTGASDAFASCCSAEPVLSCYFKDKPSAMSCADKDGPFGGVFSAGNRDGGARSFW